MFQIKICGITSVADAVMTADAGADAVGLNFYAKSPRFVTAERAKEIIRALPANVKKIGLFVNSPAEDVADAFDTLRFDLIQLHGDESPDYLAALAPRPIMKALRVGDAGLEPVLAYLEQCQRLQFPPEYVLFDAEKAGSYGGTGATTNWTAAAEYARRPDLPHLVLAGGLTPQNVAAAIDAVRPIAVDTASGVESSPGHKDPQAVVAFVKAAQTAFKNTASSPVERPSG
jgi:phosphoribosylanthranilate isomerase